MHHKRNYGLPKVVVWIILALAAWAVVIGLVYMTMIVLSWWGV